MQYLARAFSVRNEYYGFRKVRVIMKERHNWSDMQAIEIVPLKSIDRPANIIGSHIIYRRKPDGRVKARIVTWGHRDSEKDMLRTDSP
eukprot:IDg692t1